MGVFIALIVILISCLVIWRASDGFEVAADYLGRNLSDGVKGATINAIASSLPELFTSLFFLLLLRESEGFAGGVGTTAGSALFNGMIIPALAVLAVITAKVAPAVTVSSKVIWRDGIFLLLADILLILVIASGRLNWWHGLLLMSFYGVYVFYMLSSMKSKPANEEEEEEEEEQEERSSRLLGLFKLDLESLVLGKKRRVDSFNAWLLLITATSVIAIGSMWLVHACEWIASDQFELFGQAFNGFNIPIYFVAVILAAAASSVPDTILSCKDAMKGNYDDAISNALGSNIFDICFALGLPLFLYTLTFGPLELTAATMQNLSQLMVLLLLLTTITLFIFISGRSLGRAKAVVLLLLYACFAGYILGVAMELPIALQISNLIDQLVSIFRLGA